MDKNEKIIVLVDCDGTVFPFVWGADYLAERYFEKLIAYAEMIHLVNILRNDERYDFRFCTKYINEEAKRDKDVCIKRTWPGITDKEIIYVPYEDSKFDYVPEIGDESRVICLIDDYTPNLVDAERHGVVGIKAMNGVNGRFGTWKGARISVFDHPAKNMRVIQNALIQNALIQCV